MAFVFSVWARQHGTWRSLWLEVYRNFARKLQRSAPFSCRQCACGVFVRRAMRGSFDGRSCTDEHCAPKRKFAEMFGSSLRNSWAQPWTQPAMALAPGRYACRRGLATPGMSSELLSSPLDQPSYAGCGWGTGRV